MSEILLLFAHPRLEHSRVSRALLEAGRALAREDPRIAVRDLYALYPDYFIDVAAEQQALAAARLVVWLHPLHWYGMTPLLKLWLDEVLALGWAYGDGGRALRGKRLWVVASTGGDAQSYRPDGHNRHRFEAFLPPYEQTAALCGMDWHPPALLHGAHRAGAAEIDAFVDRFAAALRAWPDGGAWRADACGVADCTLPDDARPREPG